MNRAQYLWNSEVGPLYLVASEKGLEGIYWKKQGLSITAKLGGKSPEIRMIVKTISQLDEYFKGERRDFDIPFDIVVGTDFQKQVWKELAKIPYGKTCSYRDIAYKIKNEKAVRAVGSANGKNPMSVIVPCHRVIASDGTLGGYAGGLPIKQKLLALEERNKIR